MRPTDRTRTGLVTVTLSAVVVAAAATGLWTLVVPEPAQVITDTESVASAPVDAVPAARSVVEISGVDVGTGTVTEPAQVALEPVAAAPTPPEPSAPPVGVEPVDPHEVDVDEDEETEVRFEAPTIAPRPVVVSAPPRPTTEEAIAVLVAERGPSSPVSERARTIGRRTALRFFAAADAAAEAPTEAPVAESTSVPVATAASPTPRAVEPTATATDVLAAQAPGRRSLLFVWDPTIAGDTDRTAELLEFAAVHGFTALAMDATAVAYGDSAARERYARFVAEARINDVETFALMGYPWFTVSAGAGLPGQPTSSVEGLAMIETLVATGLFDGVVEDSQPYGVEYVVNGETRNWLWDQPGRAAQDMAAYLDAAQVLLGDMELIKATPFWFDSDARLVDLRDASGGPLGSMAEVVADGSDTAAVLAYRDQLEGPNGILDLVATEVVLGPTLVTVETADLGSALDFLTYFEEGHEALEEDLAAVSSRLSAASGFEGTAVHHYGPFLEMTAAADRERNFGFVGTDRVRMSSKATVDSYDSRVGSYADQVGFDSELGRFVAGGEGAVLTNGRVEITDSALVHGDVKTTAPDDVVIGSSAIVSGRVVELERNVPLLAMAAESVAGKERLRVDQRERVTVTGDQTVDRIDIQTGAQLVVVGPATVLVNRLDIGRGGSLLADTTAGPVDVVCMNSMQLREFAWIAAGDANPAGVRLRYAGSSMRLRSFAALAADVVAPNAEVVVDPLGQLYGRVGARRLTLNGAAAAHLDVALLDVPAPR